ncbi:UDP-3-O-acyl-N-acetylglucosamine deacetylase [Acidocella aromatica]|uniref:UDP-3-O-acyl-N-acetylglucosamine deacetylase n=1 Tax=Acidocella aromatica TaxID=1303579 RepID=A0A840V831_9PROT|nr:UDP-3-O-acyl-N-acetylglucosamine deacetylase [Acidocella aromatica]MBB5371906.1 UDP-3-O-[3-hydroxymyristoyl] N-acetylglucosamine deacetylase [Acidocella aromatica]
MSSLREKYSFTPSEAAPAPRRTLKAEISAVGRGLHSGADVMLRLKPAAVNSGIVFHRSDLGVSIPARFDYVTDTRLCTLISLGEAKIGTIEHLMAALAACCVDDLLIEVDGPELPVFDGSAAPFLFLLESAGITEHGGLRERLEILRPVRVEHHGAFAELRPHNPGGAGFDISLSIEFAASAIGAQAYNFHLSEEGFASEIAKARTFTLVGEIEALRKAGLARGGSLANAVVVDDDKVLNPEGLRYADEFVRHKLLDVIGDLALAGAPISGRFIGNRTGHALNNQLLRALYADQANYRLTNGSVAKPLQLTAA